VEKLARQLELYRSRSSAEVKSKIAEWDEKLLRDDTRLRAENEHLQSFLASKERQLTELQQRLSRTQQHSASQAIWGGPHKGLEQQ
jgi:hypothetical protein